MLHVQTIAVNNPRFLELQCRGLKKYCREPYRFTVFNDAKYFSDYTNNGDVGMPDKIRQMCRTLGLSCIDLPDNGNPRSQQPNASWRHARSSNFVTASHGPADRILMLDSDMFPVAPFDTGRYSKCAGVFQKRGDVDYLWPNLYFLDYSAVHRKELIQWDAITLRGHQTDSGGATHHWLRSEDISDIVAIHHLQSLDWDENQFPASLDRGLLPFLKSDVKNERGKFWCELYDERFLHYRAGCNWERLNPKIHEERTAKLYECLSALYDKD